MAERRIFLERRSYRMRRVMDAVRLWPLLGLALWMVPLLWPHPEDTGGGTVPMSTVLIYLFGVWITLILGTAALWWRTTRGVTEPEGTVPSPPEPR